MNYYEILEVTNNASDEVIKASYKALVKKYHPDNVNNLSVSKDISLINEAYEVLSNPIKRKEYDKKIKVDNVKFNDNITLEKSENTEPYSNGKLGKLFKNIGKEIFNIIDQKNSEIQNAYFEGCGMNNYELVRHFQDSNIFERAGYTKVLEERGLLKKDKNGKYIPTKEFYYYK